MARSVNKVTLLGNVARDSDAEIAVREIVMLSPKEVLAEVGAEDLGPLSSGADGEWDLGQWIKPSLECGGGHSHPLNRRSTEKTSSHFPPSIPRPRSRRTTSHPNPTPSPAEARIPASPVASQAISIGFSSSVNVAAPAAANARSEIQGGRRGWSASKIGRAHV